MVEFNITTVGTPKRDIDLFGPNTVRIDRRRTDEIAGVPVLYLSAYVADDAAFAEKVVAALAWVTDGTVSAARAGDVPNKPSPEAAAVVANDPAPSRGGGLRHSGRHCVVACRQGDMNYAAENAARRGRYGDQGL